MAEGATSKATRGGAAGSTAPAAKKAEKKAAKKASPKAASAKSDLDGGTRPSCFVMMPFAGWFQSYYEEIFVPAIKDSNLEPRRVDDLYRPSTIVHDIWKYIQQSPVMLADLTGRNPNVFYELGLAHAAGKPVLLVTQSIDDVPFDLRALRIIEYDVRAPTWASTLQHNITQGLRESLAAPAASVLPSFLGVGSAPGDGSADDPLDVLQRQVDGLQQQVRSLASRSAAPTTWTPTTYGGIATTSFSQASGLTPAYIASTSATSPTYTTPTILLAGEGSLTVGGSTVAGQSAGTSRQGPSSTPEGRGAKRRIDESSRDPREEH